MYTIESHPESIGEKFESIIDALDCCSVLALEKLENGNVMLADSCDEFYNVTLTPQQVRAFAEELIALCES